MFLLVSKVESETVEAMRGCEISGVRTTNSLLLKNKKKKKKMYMNTQRVY